LRRMSKEEKLEIVYRANGETQAQIIKGILESCGIPVFLKSLAAPSVHVFAVDGMGEVKVMVPASRAEEARALIEGKEDV
jgi:hypothetical protein